MALRMFVCSLVVFTVTHTLINGVFHAYPRSPQQWLELLFAVGFWSVLPALLLSLPLPLATALCFREIRRPAFYRFAMLIVALIVTITVWADDYFLIGELLKFNWTFAGYAAATLAANSLAVFMSVPVADRYVRDVSRGAPRQIS